MILDSKSWILDPNTAARLPDPLANDLRGVDEVVQDGGVHRLQGAGPGPLLLQLVGLPGGLGQDPPLRDEDHVLPGELLLQLTDQPRESKYQQGKFQSQNETKDLKDHQSEGKTQLVTSDVRRTKV